MAETQTTATSTTPTPGAETTEKTRRASTGINREIADEVDLAEQIKNLALAPEFTARLAEEEIDSVVLKALEDKIGLADNLIAQALGGTVDRKIDSKEEEANKKALVAAIVVVQKRAKRKYKKLDDPMREKYFLHKDITGSRSMLETSTRAILKVLPTDTLPGSKPTDITNIETALTTYLGVQTVQSQDSVEARKARIALEALVKEIIEARRDIQYAVDLIWPASDKANAAVRVAFKLNPRRSLR